MPLRLDQPTDLIAALKTITNKSEHEIELGKLGIMFCQHCLKDCTMYVTQRVFAKTVAQELLIYTILKSPAEPGESEELFLARTYQKNIKEPTDDAAPSLFEFECVNCRNFYAALMQMVSGKPTIYVLPMGVGALSTPNTPATVNYYLDQACKAQLVRAYSAAMGMYRAALHQVLHQQGFTDDQLPAQIAALETAIANKSAPEWARRLNPEALKLIKEIGNSQMHANDVVKLKALDDEAMRRVLNLFVYLVQCVYEEPARKAATKDKLQKALDNTR